MKNSIKYIGMVILVFTISGCGDYLDKEPQDILLDEQVWSDPELATSVLANLYNRLQPFAGLEGSWADVTDTDLAMWSGQPIQQWRNERQNFPNNFREQWRYGLIRDIQIFLENVEASREFTDEERSRLLAEGRFIRAYVYFQHVRSMGGVPLVLQSYTYTGPDGVEEMQIPRSTEEEVYDFISTEIAEIKDDLPQTGESKTRANRWTALALKSRAMLYAASIAKYNNLLATPIETPGREVGIPASRAEDYYTQSLAASEEIIQGGPFALYNANPDKKENFYELFTNKQGNPEVIWANDYTLEGKYHSFTFENIPRSMRENPNGSSGITPTLHLVESYDYLDGSQGVLNTRTEDGDFVYYDNPEDIFTNKDARLWGTVIYPGAEFRGSKVSIQAGVMVWNDDSDKFEIETSNTLGDKYTDGGLLVGADGPIGTTPFATNTGFYSRKYLDSRAGSGVPNEGSDVWWIRFRLGEILLNAAEASFELNREGPALTYINQLRERAGFGPNSLGVDDLDMEKIRQERMVELALEGHRWWDLKRWRIAHELYDGNSGSPIAMANALWPYRVVDPENPERNGKYVFEKRVAPRFNQPLFFQMSNYYSAIPQGALNANPLLVRNPFH
ncbi:RagB/SusD family nutrient uptake outer membrane protein [Sinomicrobium sp. M5D2P9]